MESWLIFQHRDWVVCTMQGRRAMECPVKGFKGVSQGSPVYMSSRNLTKSPNPTLPRKAAKEIYL